jgi:phosphatidylglycerophosphatase A
MLAWPGLSAVEFILFVALVLFGANRIPTLARGFSKGLEDFKRGSRDAQSALDAVIHGEPRPVADALTVANATAEDTSQPAPPGVKAWVDRFTLWVAEGFGVGRIPIAPGAFGSLLGLLWVTLLLFPGSLAYYCFGTVAGIGVSVWFCGRAAVILGRRDPPSVVLDQIVAMPVCFALPALLLLAGGQRVDAPQPFLLSAWWHTVQIFLLFQFLGVAKPWPIPQSRSLPGGWGMAVDDLLAAAYVNVVVLVVIGVRAWGG